MWWCWPSATGPGCSGTGHLGRAATPRTSTCRVISRSWSRPILETGRPTVLLSVSGRPYALGPYRDRAGGNRAGVLPRRGGRRRDRRGAVRPGEPLRQAAGRGAAPRRWPAAHVPGAAARAEQPGRQQPRSDARRTGSVTGSSYTSYAYDDLTADAVRRSTSTARSSSASTVPTPAAATVSRSSSCTPPIRSPA